MTKISKLNNKPLKKFGQNYLVDQNIISKFVDTFDPQIGEQIIEIGPGRGAITNELVKKIPSITAFEIDNRVINDLSEIFPEIKFVNHDFLKIDFSEFLSSNFKYRVIGNIPFNITSPILFKLIYSKNYLLDALFIVQLDVAKRIIANPNTKEYGILSVILNYFCNVSLCFEISSNSFYPKPKVKSAVIHLDFNKELLQDFSTDMFINVVKASFGNRRKTLKNSLNNSIFRNCNFSEINLDFSKRAENLTVEDYIILTRSLTEQKCYGR